MAVEEASVDRDPMTQLSSWLADARRAGEPMPEAMAVATATPEGRPSSRMVLLRGVDHRGLVFYTDQESGKGQELKVNPFAAALFHWFKPAHRQVRVTGAVEVVESSLSDAYWQSRPPGSRRSAVASHQSQVIVSRAALEEEVTNLAEAFPDDSGPACPLRWGGYRIRPMSSNCGKKERTACTIGFATAFSPEAGGSSDCHPDQRWTGSHSRSRSAMGDGRSTRRFSRSWSRGPSRHDHRSAFKAPGLQGRVGIHSGVQGEGGDFGPQQSSSRQVEDLDQLGAAAPVGRLNGDFVWH